MDVDYKKYSLEKLEEWVHDALSCGEASPQEIFDVIKNVVSENYYIYKNHTERCYELLALLNGNGKGHIQIGNGFYPPTENLVCDKDDPSLECQKSWTSFWEDEPYPMYVSEDGDVWIPDSVVKDKVKKWQLPVEVDGLTGDCFVNFPDDLLEAANLKEGDQIEWIEQDDGSYLFKKVDTKPSWVEGNEVGKTKTYDEMIAEGWTMTADGFWIKE